MWQTYSHHYTKVKYWWIFCSLHSVKQAMLYVTFTLTTSLCAWIRCVSVFTPPFTKMSNEIYINVHILTKNIYCWIYLINQKYRYKCIYTSGTGVSSCIIWRCFDRLWHSPGNNLGSSHLWERGKIKGKDKKTTDVI